MWRCLPWPLLLLRLCVDCVWLNLGTCRAQACAAGGCAAGAAAVQATGAGLSAAAWAALRQQVAGIVASDRAWCRPAECSGEAAASTSWSRRLLAWGLRKHDRGARHLVSTMLGVQR